MWLLGISVALFLAGALFTFDSLSGITGHIVSDKIGSSAEYTVGLILIIAGIMSYFFFRGRDSLRQHNKEGHRIVGIEYRKKYIAEPARKKKTWEVVK